MLAHLFMEKGFLGGLGLRFCCSTSFLPACSVCWHGVGERESVKTTREAATQLGVSRVTLQRYIAKKLITPPKPVKMGKKSKIRFWTTKDIQRVKKELKRK